MTTTHAFRQALHIPWSDPDANEIVAAVVPGAEYATDWLSAAGIPEAPSDGLQYSRQSAGWSAVSWAALAGKPSTFPPAGHTHAESEVTGLLADLAARVLKAGDTMTGPLVLPAGSVSATSLNFGTPNTGIYGTAAPDVRIAAGGSTRLTILNSSITAGVRILQVDGAVGQPSYSFTNDTDSGMYRAGAGDIRLAVDAGDVVKFLGSDKSATFSGPVMLTGNPSVALQAAPKQYVDSRGLPAGGTAGQVLSKTDATDYNVQWVAASGGGGGIADAPSDGKIYARLNAAWAEVSVDAGTY